MLLSALAAGDRRRALLRCRRTLAIGQHRSATSSRSTTRSSRFADQTLARQARCTCPTTIRPTTTSVWSRSTKPRFKIRRKGLGLPGSAHGDRRSAAASSPRAAQRSSPSISSSSSTRTTRRSTRSFKDGLRKQPTVLGMTVDVTQGGIMSFETAAAGYRAARSRPRIDDRRQPRRLARRSAVRHLDRRRQHPARRRVYPIARARHRDDWMGTTYAPIDDWHAQTRRLHRSARRRRQAPDAAVQRLGTRRPGRNERR